MWKFLATGAFAATLGFATPVFAISFTGTFTVNSDAATDPALVIATNPGLGMQSAPFSFDLNFVNDFEIINGLFQIGTPEGSVGFPFTDPADSQQKDITVSFNFTQPDTFGGTIEGTTRGVWLIQTGLLHWDGPITVDFGNGGRLFISLFDTSFHMAGRDGPKFSLVDAKFKLKEVPTAVPLPAALPLLAGGLGGMGLMGWWRRRRPTQLG
jgi:hypothetical protein